MIKNFDECFNLILLEEGGYVNDPRDPGGRTNMGVTQRAWENYIKSSVTEEVMRKLTPDRIKPFYKSMYWDKVRGDILPSGLDYATFDFAVNSGPFKAIKCLQEIAGVVADGIMGPKSLDAIMHCNREQTIDALCDMRMEFLRKLPKFKDYGRGWSSRVQRVKNKALHMV